MLRNANTVVKSFFRIAADKLDSVANLNFSHRNYRSIHPSKESNGLPLYRILENVLSEDDHQFFDLGELETETQNKNKLPQAAFKPKTANHHDTTLATETSKLILENYLRAPKFNRQHQSTLQNLSRIKDGEANLAATVFNINRTAVLATIFTCTVFLYWFFQPADPSNKPVRTAENKETQLLVDVEPDFQLAAKMEQFATTVSNVDPYTNWNTNATTTSSSCNFEDPQNNCNRLLPHQESSDDQNKTISTPQPYEWCNTELPQPGCDSGYRDENEIPHSGPYSGSLQPLAPTLSNQPQPTTDIRHQANGSTYPSPADPQNDLNQVLSTQSFAPPLADIENELPPPDSNY